MLYQLALRNIWRNRRRTLLTLSAMIVSSALLILALSVFSGMLRDMLATATEQYYGHMVISRQGYQDNRDMYRHFPPSQLTEDLSRREEVVGMSPRLRSFGLLSHQQDSAPAELLGVLPHDERNVTGLQDSLIHGRYLNDEVLNGAVVGAGLARRLNVAPGDSMVFVTQAADGSIGNDLLLVEGVFRTGDVGHDNSLVLVPLSWLQAVMALPGQIHEVAVRTSQPFNAAVFAHQYQPLLAEGLEVLDWGQMLPEMQEVVASYNVSRLIIVTILYVATGLGILNTFFMSVMERTREFGVLMAIGMRPGQVRRMVLLESLFMGCLALVCGVIVGLGLSLYMAVIGIDLSTTLTPITYAGGTILPRLRAMIEPANILIPSLSLLLICLFAGFLPANRAARMPPVVAIRED